MNTAKKAALKESITDTGLGMFINLPANYLLLAIGLHFNMGALALTIFMTSVFTVIAVIRKYYIRLHFIALNTDSDSTLATEQYAEAMKRYHHV